MVCKSSQEDILRDLFRDARFQQVFQGLLREFQRSGFRFGPQFIRKTFFGYYEMTFIAQGRTMGVVRVE